jgi:hypothetical protein
VLEGEVTTVSDAWVRTDGMVMLWALDDGVANECGYNSQSVDPQRDVRTGTA